ncbi:MAG: BrnT family toxin [Planctomyces sp.]
MDFEWDILKAARNLTKHGVAFAEAATVFADPLAITFFDPAHSDDEDRFVTFGYSCDGLETVVCHTDRGWGVIESSAPALQHV